MSGLIDIPAFAAKFEARLYGYKKRLSITSKPRRGRGTSGKWAGSRPLAAGGTFVASGKIRLDGAPMPIAWRGQEGTVTITHDTGKTETLPIRVEGMGADFNEKSEDTADVSLSCQIISTPSYTGFATAPTATDPTKADQQQWEGTQFTYDAQGLQTSAIVVVDFWGDLANTDAAEEARLIAAVAAALPPMANLKKRPASLARDSDDGGTITFTWGLTDTEEDILNAVTAATADPLGHAAAAVTAAINATPAASSGLVARTTTTKELNDQKSLQTTEHAERTTRDDVTFPRTKKSHDVSSLAEEDLACVVFTTGSPPTDPTPPTGKVITDYFDVPDTNAAASNLSYRVYTYGLVSNSQKLTLPRYELETDPNGLDTVKRSGVVWDSAGAAPSDPALPSGLKLVSKTDIGIPTHPTKQIRVYRWEPNDSVDKRTNPRTRTETDAQAITRDQYTAVVFTTASPPTDPTPPTGLKLVGFVDAPDTPTQSVRVYHFAYTDSKDRLELGHYRTVTDPNGLDSEKVSGVVWDSAGDAPDDPTPPDGLKLVTYTDVGIPDHPTKQVRVYRWAKNDSVDRLVLPNTFTHVDPSNITSHGKVAAFNATPTVPGGYKSRGTVGFYQNGTDLLNVTDFALNDEADDVTHRDTVARTQSFQGTTADTASLLATTDTAAAIATSLLATYKASTTFEGATVKKLHDGLAEVILHTRDDEVIVRYRFWGTGKQLVPAYYDGSDVYVFLRQKIKVGTNLWQFELAEQYRNGARGEFSIDRRVSGSSVDLFAGSMNTSNSGAFLGLGAGKVAYAGLADGESNISVAAPRVSRVVYGFSVDSNGFIDMADASTGWQFTTSDLTSVGPGWVTASALGLSSTVLAGADYSGFIA